MKEFLIKLYFYLDSGNSIVNNFKNIIIGIFALYIMFKVTSPAILILMFILVVPILITLGYINIHLISKVRERLSTQYGTHYAIRQFELIEEQVNLLKEISKKL